MRTEFDLPGTGFRVPDEDGNLTATLDSERGTVTLCEDHDRGPWGLTVLCLTRDDVARLARGFGLLPE